MNSTIDLLMSRRSHRAYKQDKVPQEYLDVLIKAATASPSAVNRQPWHFTFVTDEKLIAKINDAGCDAFKAIGDPKTLKLLESRKWQILYNAPCVVFISGEEEAKWGVLDCGIATQNIVIAAESLGLGTVIIGMIDVAFEGENGKQLAQELCIPEGHKFAIAICIGYPDDDKVAHLVGENKVTVL